MPFRLKTSIDNFGATRTAARLRITDDPGQNRSDEEIDLLVDNYLRANIQQRLPRLVDGRPMDSNVFREFLKDTKFFIALHSISAGELETEITNTAKLAFGTLNDLQQEALVLDSLISEEEIKVRGGFTTVHFNSFVRQIDKGLQANNPHWLTDYKTGFTFLPENEANIITGTGITLPVRERVRIPIVDATLVAEETDYGDSRQPLVSNDPRNVFLRDKIFRHVIIRREHDNTSRVFNRTPSYLTIQLELPNIQLVNLIRINPVGQSTLQIESISYVNESAEEVTLTTTVLPGDTHQVILFEPVRTRFLRIKFQQFAPVSKTFHNVRDERAKEINKILRGIGWTQGLPENPEAIQGRVFDFSLEQLEVGLIVYQSLGVYRSKSVKVKKPLGVSLSSAAENLASPVGTAYSQGFQLPEGTVLNEYYLGIRLKNRNGTVVLNDLIPIPDTLPNQSEFLPLVGTDARVKLFPDMLWSLSKDLVTSITYSGTEFTVTTDTEHGLLVGDSVSFLGPLEHPVVNLWTVDTVTSTTEFTVDAGTALTSLYESDENTAPRIYAYKSDVIDAFGVASTINQSTPVFVMEDDDVLTVGIDYEISIDDGATWIGSFPRGVSYLESLETARSGEFRIRVLNPNYDKVYWIEYRPLRNQFLGRTNRVRLKNGRVVFHRRLRKSIGTINTVIVSRADTTNPYVSPVVLFYALKVREDVS